MQSVAALTARGPLAAPHPHPRIHRHRHPRPRRRRRHCRGRLPSLCPWWRRHRLSHQWQVPPAVALQPQTPEAREAPAARPRSPAGARSVVERPRRRRPCPSGRREICGATGSAGGSPRLRSWGAPAEEPGAAPAQRGVGRAPRPCAQPRAVLPARAHELGDAGTPVRRRACRRRPAVCTASCHQACHTAAAVVAGGPRRRVGTLRHQGPKQWRLRTG